MGDSGLGPRGGSASSTTERVRTVSRNLRWSSLAPREDVSGSGWAGRRPACPPDKRKAGIAGKRGDVAGIAQAGGWGRACTSNQAEVGGGGGHGGEEEEAMGRGAGCEHGKE